MYISGLLANILFGYPLGVPAFENLRLRYRVRGPHASRASARHNLL